MWQPCAVKGKKRWKVAGISIAALVFAAGRLLWPAPEPVYQGKSLSYWLHDTDVTWGGYWRLLRPEAKSAVRAIGTNAIPTLLKLVSARDAPLTGKINSFLMHVPWVSFRFETVSRKRMDASNGFLVLGPLGKDAVPGLLRMYTRTPHDQEQRQTIVAIFGNMRSAAEDSVPYLVHDLANEPDNNLRASIAYSLGTISTRTEIVIPALIAALSDSAFHVRERAVDALGELHAQPESVIPALVAMLRNDNADLTYQVTVALGEFGPMARAALPIVKRMVFEGELQVSSTRQYLVAKSALAKIEPSNSELCDFPN